MSPSIFTLLQRHLAAIKNMTGGFSILAKFTMITSGFSPLQQIVSSWQCVCYRVTEFTKYLVSTILFEYTHNFLM